MPDQWGRVGYNDFMGLAKGLETFQAMGQRRTEFAEKQQYKEDYEGNLRALKAGPSEAKPHEVNGEYVSPESLQQPVQMVGSERSQIAAKKDFAIGLEADLGIADAKQGANVSALSEKITAWKTENPDASFDQIPINLTAGVAGQKAKANVIGLYGESAEAQKIFMQNRIPIIKEHAKNFFNNKKLVNDAMGAGNEEMAINGLIQMSKELTATPYQLGEYNKETKSFELKYFDRRTGKLQKNGTKPLDEVIQEMNALGEKEFINITAASMESKRQENLKEEANPKHGKTSSGTATLVTAQIDPMNQDGGVAITVRNEKTGETLANYPSWEAFYDAGNSKEELKRTKALADIGAANALKGERDDKGKYYQAQTAALGGGGKYKERNYYDAQGNKYPAKSQKMAQEFEEKGWSIENPKMNETMYENNVKAFSIQIPGFSEDMETGTVSGVISEKNWGSALKAANDKGLSLMDEHGLVVDANGGWPGGKEQAVKVSVMPMGTSKSGGDLAGVNKVGKFDSDPGENPGAGDAGRKNPKDTNAMGEKKEAPADELSFLPKNILDKVNARDIGAPTSAKYKTRGLFNDIGNNIQENAAWSQYEKGAKFGETEIEKQLRLASGIDDLGVLKNVADMIREEYPNITDKEIGAMVASWVKKQPVNNIVTAAQGGR